MASSTRTVEGVGVAIFDFVATRSGTVSFFSNDLNISFDVLAQYPSAMQRIHAGPILFIASAQVSQGARVTIVPRSIASGFPPPPLSLLQLQTDTVAQVPTAAEQVSSLEADPWEQS